MQWCKNMTCEGVCVSKIFFLEIYCDSDNESDDDDDKLALPMCCCKVVSKFMGREIHFGNIP